MASTTAYAYERLYEVLVGGCGVNRQLAVAHRFARGAAPGLPPDVRSTRAKERPTVFAIITDLEVEQFASGEMSDSHLYRVNVSIYRDHWLGFGKDPHEVETMLSEASDAYMRMRAALCWVGNLGQTEGGQDTGIAGKALNAPKSKSRLLSVATIGKDHRLLQYLDVFTAEFDYSPDA